VSCSLWAKKVEIEDELALLQTKLFTVTREVDSSESQRQRLELGIHQAQADVNRIKSAISHVEAGIGPLLQAGEAFQASLRQGGLLFPKHTLPESPLQISLSLIAPLLFATMREINVGEQNVVAW